jgi:hypothetical protein
VPVGWPPRPTARTEPCPRAVSSVESGRGK